MLVDDQEFVPFAVPQGGFDELQPEFNILGAAHDGYSAELHRRSDFLDVLQPGGGLHPEHGVIRGALFEHVDPRPGAFA